MLRPLGPIAVVVIVTVSCGGGDDNAGEDPGPVSTPTTDAATDGTPETTTTTVSSTTTTTVAPVTAMTPDEIHGLVVEWADGTAAPLDLADRITGFPLAIPVPDGSTPYSVSVRLSAVDPDLPFVWDWTYESFASGTVGDVDIARDDNGPGAVELRQTYDPIMGELGWTYSNSTGSDPGDPGGPNSINHVYVAGEEQLTIAGAEATPRPAFVWLDDDLVFGPPETPGYQVDVSFDLINDVIPVPILATLADAVPTIDGARLFSAQLRSLDRPDDSFDADEGLRLLDAELEWRLPAGSEAAAQELYSARLDGEVIQPGEESFFDEGTVEVVEPRIVGDDWQQPVVVVGRYAGNISVETTDGDSGEVAVVLTVRMEPNRELLSPPAQ